MYWRAYWPLQLTNYYLPMLKMKYFLTFLFLSALSVKAQESKEFTVEGELKKTMTVNLSSLAGFPSVKVDSITIYNHLMQRKSSIKNITAVPLKELLSGLEITSDSPKSLSEYYLVCTATDGYKVVLSWNEVFNSSSDNNILVLKSFDTEPQKAEKGNIALLVPADKATGRRFVKGLHKISILRVN